MEAQAYRFGEFELDLGAWQLRHRGEPVRLERRPLELLILLVSQHGRMVPREEIIRRLWPDNVVIDFDTGLNTLVRKVRQALGDSTESPAFIETVAGVGYRFIAPVTQRPSGEGPAAAPVPAAVRAPALRRYGPIGVALLLLAGIAWMLWRGPDPDASQVSIVVLPFENLTEDRGLDYLAAGLADETNATLAQMQPERLRLIGRVSADAYAGSDKATSQIGRELGVDYVVASSLRAEQSRIRVTSRLVRAADGVQVWTASFDRELTSVLGLQRELSTAIAEQVRLRLSPDVADAIARRQTRDAEAYELYLRGQHAWSQISQGGNRAAIDYFERAIAEDPEYALAWAGLARVLSTAPLTGDAEPAATRSRVDDAVHRAVRFGADLPEVQFALGYYEYLIHWDWRAAEAAFERAVALDPNNAVAHLLLGHVLSQTGRHAEARPRMRRARELDPFFSHTFALSATVAFQARDYEQAVEFSRQAIAINPEGWVGYVNLAQALAGLGRHEEALAALETAERYSGGNSKVFAFRGHVLARMGRATEARAVIRRLGALAAGRYVPPYAVALVHAGLGEHDAALDWLERALAAGDVHLVFLTVDPRWDGLRADSRFQSLLDRCGFLTVGNTQTVQEQ